MQNYKLISRSREDGYGGVGFLVHRKVGAKQVDTNLNLTHIEILQIKTKFLNNNLNIITFYNPPNGNINTEIKEFQKIIENTENNENTLIAGDINAHSNMWGNASRENKTGKKIADIISNSNLQLLNTGKPTRINLRNHTMSTLDITLCTQDIFNKVSWDCIEENIGSDHLPIIINININRFTRREIIDWKKVTQETTNIEEVENSEQKNIEIILEEIIEQNTRTVTCNHKNSPKSWWNAQLQRLWDIKSLKLKCYNRYKNLYTATELLRSVAVMKREIKLAKRKSWETFVTSINPNINTKQLWNKINKLKNKRGNGFNLLEEYDMAKKFINENFPESIEEIRLPMERTSMSQHKFNDKIIKETLKQKQNTAPGENKISYKILKNIIEINPNVIKNIVTYLNQIYIDQIYPEKWKITKVIAIKKPNKDEYETGSYRPICLHNTISKIFNKSILEELNQHITNKQVLPANSYGFRKGYNIMDYFVNLFSEIEAEKTKHKVQILITTDISKAFDNVIKDILIQKLKEIDTPKHIINWIYQFLTNRKIILDNGTNTIKQTTNKGIPQGSCLSPCLFNVYTKEIHSLQKPEVSIYQFADDVAILVKGKNERAAIDTSNIILRKLNEELTKIELKINPEKSTFMRLYKNKPTESQIKINNIRLKEEKEIKLLGVRFTNKISLVPHYKYLEKEIGSATNLLKAITHKNGGAHPHMITNVYKAIIQTRTKFADTITPTNIKNSIQIKQKIINKNLRICTGMLKTTPIPTLLAETATLPADLDNKLTSLKYIANNINKNSNAAEKIKNNQIMEKLRKLYIEYDFMGKIAQPENKITRTTKNIIIHEEMKQKSRKTNLNHIEIMSIYTELLNKYNEHQHIYTDGSLKEDKGGIGIYFKNLNEEIKIKLKNKATIKTIETLAIKTAIEKSIQRGFTKIVIFTDSKSSCTSLNKVMENRKYKYYEKEILDKVAENENTKIIIHWIPGHMGILGNEKADKLAKQAIEEPDETLENLITVEDAHQIIEEEIRQEWRIKYNNWTTEIGKYNKQINNMPPIKPWYHKAQMSSYNIRQINRLRTGHAKNKKFLKIVGIEENNLCDICHTIEDSEHIVEKCTKYNQIRRKYTLIQHNKLIDILKSENTKNYKILCDYLKEIDYKL